MKTSRDFEAEFLRDIRKETGRTLDEWMAITEILPATDRENMQLQLMREYSVSFRQATLIITIFLNDRKPRYA